MDKQNKNDILTGMMDNQLKILQFQTKAFNAQLIENTGYIRFLNTYWTNCDKLWL